MPKKSKKSCSKRTSLKDKYKVIKKVKQHHRKIRKEEAKKGKKKASLLKDPGIPASAPEIFKEQFRQQMELQRQRILEQEAAKKEAAKLRRQERKANGGAEMDEMAADAARQAADFANRKRARLTEENTADADGSRKAFYREFKRVVEAADVIIQVLDARDPLSCRCTDVERYIRSVNPNKRVILLLNKIDLVPRDATEAWLKYFREEAPAVAFKCSTQQQRTNLGQKRMGAKANLETSECLGADTLLQMLKNYTRNKDIKVGISVGVVGLPNVGKSSLINSLKRARVAHVGNQPGVTKSVQEVVLDKHIRLLDSPGIVFSSSDDAAVTALRNAIKIERLADPVLPVRAILDRVAPKQLCQIYSIAMFDSVDGFLQLIAQARGKLKKGGAVDAEAAARIVLHDWNDGKIPFFTRPPTRGNKEHASAAVVADYSAEFDADKVFASEANAVIAGLPGTNDAERQYVEAAAAPSNKVDFDALEEEDDDAAGSMEGSDMEDDDALLALAARRKRGDGVSASGQRSLLYGEPGQFDPHAARAEKKRRKKEAAGGGDEDYDFDEAWGDAEKEAAARGGGMEGSDHESGESGSEDKEGSRDEMED